VEKYLEAIDAAFPQSPIVSLNLFQRYKATTTIADFVSHFAVEEGRADLSHIPQPFMLEWLAERFHRYLRGTETLDEAFGLMGDRPGRISPREMLRRRGKLISANILYDQLRARGVRLKKAIGEVARALKISESSARGLIFRKAKLHPIARK